MIDNLQAIFHEKENFELISCLLFIKTQMKTGPARWLNELIVDKSARFQKS